MCSKQIDNEFTTTELNNVTIGTTKINNNKYKNKNDDYDNDNDEIMYNSNSNENDNKKPNLEFNKRRPSCDTKKFSGFHEKSNVIKTKNNKETKSDSDNERLCYETDSSFNEKVSFKKKQEASHI